MRTICLSVFGVLSFFGALAQTTVTTSGGTANAVPKFSDSSTIANSVITEVNGHVGIGKTNPQEALDVTGGRILSHNTVVIGLDNPLGASLFVNGPIYAQFQQSLLYGTQACCSTGAGFSAGSSLGSTAGVSSSNNGAFFNSNGTADGDGNVGAQINTSLPSWRMALGSGTAEWPGGDNFAIGRVAPGGSYMAPSILFKVSNSGFARVAGGIVFPDGSIQTQAQLVGPQGPQGPQGIQGPTGPPGPISGVTAGSGLTGGGTSGTVTLAVDGTVARTNISQTFTGTQTIFGNLLLGITNNAGGGFSANGGVTFSNNFGGVIITGVCINIGVCMDLNQRGEIHTSGGSFVGGGDYAESVDVSGDRKIYKHGDVLVIDPTGKRKFMLSEEAYSTSVAGIYSTKPGIVGSRSPMDDKKLAEEVPVAMLGIVPCKVTAENGEIEPGDLLVTAATPGHAMKGTDKSRMLGAIVGKALEPLKAGTGVIEIMVMLQ